MPHPQDGNARPPAADAHLDLLSVIGSIGVVLVHASMYWTGWLGMNNSSWWLANVGNAAGRFGSAIFVMITGAVLLQRASERAPVSFVVRRWRRLAPVLAFWSLAYFAWRQLRGDRQSGATVVHDLFLGVPAYHLWFLFMLMGLYVWIPLLRPLLRPGNSRVFQYTVLCGCAAATWLSAGLQAVTGRLALGSLGFSPLFMVYLMGGYLLYRDRPRVPPVLLAVVQGISIAGMVLGVGILYPGIGDAAFPMMYSNRSTLAMLLTFSLFVRVLQLPAGHPLLLQAGKLAPLTFGIYVVHPFWLDVVGYAGIDSDNEEWLLAGLAAYLLSAATALGMRTVPVLRRFML
jgi:surface polysaccharide O-acyltransferase-like enzyme